MKRTEDVELVGEHICGVQCGGTRERDTYGRAYNNSGGPATSDVEEAVNEFGLKIY